MTKKRIHATIFRMVSISTSTIHLTDGVDLSRGFEVFNAGIALAVITAKPLSGP